MEGKKYLIFNDKEISKQKAKLNYQYWQKKDKIPLSFRGEYNRVFKEIKKVHGAHTFAARAVHDDEIIVPLFRIFSFNETLKNFHNDPKAGLICDKIRKGDGRHMGTARKLGLDKYVFSYLGMHLPYHRDDDDPPVCPFGIFIKPNNFAKTHGAPCDRDYNKNDEVDKNQLDKYFLLPTDLQRVITNRIFNDELFNGDFWKYFGNPDIWEDANYRKNHWKRKGEYCHFERVSPEDIAAILWPIWEETAVDGSFIANDLFDVIQAFKQQFDIAVILYRPYHEIIDKQNWESKNLRDWELSLVEASCLAHKYYAEIGQFPESILEAKNYFISK